MGTPWEHLRSTLGAPWEHLGSTLGQVSTAEGPDGDWSNWTLCDEGEAVELGLARGDPTDPNRTPVRPKHLWLSVSRSQSQARSSEAMQAMQGFRDVLRAVLRDMTSEIFSRW